MKKGEKRLENKKKDNNSQNKCFNQLSGAPSTQKLVEIHSIQLFAIWIPKMFRPPLYSCYFSFADPTTSSPDRATNPAHAQHPTKPDQHPRQLGGSSSLRRRWFFPERIDQDSRGPAFDPKHQEAEPWVQPDHGDQSRHRAMATNGNADTFQKQNQESSTW